MKLRLLSYNIHKGFDTLGAQFVLEGIKQALLRSECDILLLQEVVGENLVFKKKIKNYPTESQFEFLADTVWPHFSYGKNAIFEERHHGNAILSRYPISFAENLNISTNRWESRGLLHCEVSIPGKAKPLHIFNTHLDLKKAGRQSQMAKICQRAITSVGRDTPFILGGDFNDWTESLTPQFENHLGVTEAHYKAHGRHARSYPSFYPVLCLDRVYYRNLDLLSCQVLTGAPWTKLSDHLPLLTEFEIQKQEP